MAARRLRCLGWRRRLPPHGSSSPPLPTARAASMQEASRAIRSSPTSSSTPASSGAIPCARSNGSTSRTTGASARKPISTAPRRCSYSAAEAALDRAGRHKRERRRCHRHRVLDRHRHAEPGRARGRATWDFGRRRRGCRCSGLVAPAASPGCRSARGWRAPSRARSCCVVAVELCTLAFRNDRSTKADVISSALFGDGAAAAVLRAERERGAAVRSAPPPSTPGRARSTSWAGRSIRSASASCCRVRCRASSRAAGGAGAPLREGRSIEAPRFICHPGGAKVLDAVETALELQKGTLRDEREVLRGHGNMSAPSVLVRARARAQARPARNEACSRRSAPDSPRAFSRLRQRMIRKVGPGFLKRSCARKT